MGQLIEVYFKLEPVTIWGTQALAVKISLEIKVCTLDGSHFQWSVSYKTHFFERQPHRTEGHMLHAKRQEGTRME